ncbi:MAG TPA: hypothetical protein PLB59_10440 [Bacteroidales bacterium]|nr:hypothetical protein [Bacteroidales bacterium]HPI30820.1 hypothetical protein [Bacteroidales bacterium]HQN16650.1 hypothetical protein [Bacteroidales bacterium]HQP16372.1 hypothetical protein [Bacteroidales bacterium]
MSITVISGLFLLISVIIIGLGLLMLILGIIQKKTGQWVSGILITLFALVFCIIGLVWLVGKKINTACDNSKQSEYYDQPYDDDMEENYGDTVYHGDESMATDENYISGFIQDDDKSLIHIRVIPHPLLEDLGIDIKKIDTYATTGKKNIPLHIGFSKKFKGALELALYSSEGTELGKSLVEINQEENSAFTVNFSFSPETNFLKTEYARINSSY